MPDFTWVADDNKPGVANGYDLNLVTKTIKEQKKDADYLIIYMHWGVEKSNRPVEYQNNMQVKWLQQEPTRLLEVTHIGYKGLNIIITFLSLTP